MESKNRSKETEEHMRDSNSFHREIKLLQLRISSLQQSQSQRIYPVLISSLDNWLQERWQSLDKGAGVVSMEPNVALVFFIRTIIEVLSEGSLTEKEIRSSVIDVCKDVGVKATARGSIVGLSLDLPTACSILASLGILEPDYSPSVQMKKTASLSSLRRRYLAPLTPPAETATTNSVGPTNNSPSHVDCPIGGSAPPNVTTTSTVFATFPSSVSSATEQSTLASALPPNSSPNACIGTLGAVEAENKALEILRRGDVFGSSGTSSNSDIINSGANHLAGGVLLFESLTNRWRASLETYLKDCFASRAKLAAAAASKLEAVNAKPISNTIGVSNDSTDLEPDADVEIDDYALLDALEVIGDSTERRNPRCDDGISVTQREDTSSPLFAGIECSASTNATSATTNVNTNAIGESSMLNDDSAGNCLSTATNITTCTAGTQVVVPPLDMSSIVSNAPILSQASTRLDKTLPALTSVNSGTGASASRKDKGSTGTGGSGSKSTKRSVNQRVWKLSEDITPLMHPEVLLKELLRASYEEAVALEIEEILLRKLAGQCEFELPAEPYRPGTTYLNQTPVHGVETAQIKFGSKVGTLKSGANITAVDLWEKARLAYLKRKARSRGLTASAISRPDVINSLSVGFPFPHPSKINEEGVEFKKDRRSTPTSSQSSSALTSAMLTDRDKGFIASFMNAKIRSYVPILSISHENEFSDDLTLKGSIYTAQHPTNFSSNTGANYNPFEATVVRPDIELRTAPMPWKAIAAEFVTLDHEDFGDALNTSNTLSQKSGRLNDTVISRTSSMGEFGPSTSARVSVRPYYNVLSNETKAPTLYRCSSTSAMQACGFKKSGQVIGRSTSVDSAMNLPQLRTIQETIDISSRNDSLMSISTNRIATVLAPRFSQIIPISTSNCQTWSLKRVDVHESSNKEVVDADNDDSDGDAGCIDIEDISDETMTQKHHAVLRKMRDRWKQLQQLRLEHKYFLMSSGINKSNNYGYSTDGPSYNSSSPRGSFSESETVGRPYLPTTESRTVVGQRKRGRGRPPKISHTHAMPLQQSHAHLYSGHVGFNCHQSTSLDTAKEVNSTSPALPMEITTENTAALETDPCITFASVEKPLTSDKCPASKRQRRSSARHSGVSGGAAIGVNLKQQQSLFNPTLLASNIHLIAASPGNCTQYSSDSSHKPVEGSRHDNGVGRPSPCQAQGRGHHLKTAATPSPNNEPRTTAQS